ncbi:SDR family oxidoreductase [Granulicella sibirica]|uniref:SDR family oxidoreductase n=1 Tax=Granulicella sibirica TaxID=2479048 RepID=UPI0010090E70|nr:SDR family NAD(P)-dependent oxidoreductase [Granulicella sibirica]
MNMTGNTILLTGGTSGIGLALAIQLQALGNTVIVTGRDRAKLEALVKDHPLIHTIQSDVSDTAAIAALYQHVTTEFPALNVLINNAGIMRKIDLQSSDFTHQDVTREVEVNLMGPMRMVNQFLAHLKLQPDAAIVTVSSGLAFLPLPISPIYCATKAGIHSYTQSLRVQLRNTKIRDYELAPPATDTGLMGAFDATDMKGISMMDVNKLAKLAIHGMKADRPEILPGLSKVLRLISRVAPTFGLKLFSGSTDAMLAQIK